MIRAENLTKIFGPQPDEALRLLHEGQSKDAIREATGHVVGVDDVSFRLKRGEFFVIMGLSGSGKSTLLRCLNRLIPATGGRVVLDTDEGEIDVGEADAKQLRDIRTRHLSMVFQRFGLLPHRSVRDNVAYGLEIQGVDRRERLERADRALDMVGLGGWGPSRTSELSGGMQQRVGLARALCTDPEVLLMDEAFSALDPLIRREMQDELLRLQEELAKTIVFITHDLDEALRLGDRVAILKDGLLVQVGTPAEIVMHPADAYVRAFVEDVDRSRVLKVRHVMQRPAPPAAGDAQPATASSGVRLHATMPLQDALTLLAEAEGTLAVVDADGSTVGQLDARTALAALVRGQRDGV